MFFFFGMCLDQIALLQDIDVYVFLCFIEGVGRVFLCVCIFDQIALHITKTLRWIVISPPHPLFFFMYHDQIFLFIYYLFIM